MSRVVAGMIELPTICAEHTVYYPAVLADQAERGTFYAFETACECPTAYLIHTEPSGAHCKAADTAEAISELYEALPGDEYLIYDEHGTFTCELLGTSPAPSTGTVAPVMRRAPSVEVASLPVTHTRRVRPSGFAVGHSCTGPSLMTPRTASSDAPSAGNPTRHQVAPAAA